MSGPGRRYMEQRLAELRGEEQIEDGGGEPEVDVHGPQAPVDWTQEPFSDALLAPELRRLLELRWT